MRVLTSGLLCSFSICLRKKCGNPCFDAGCTCKLDPPTLLQLTRGLTSFLKSSKKSQKLSEMRLCMSQSKNPSSMKHVQVLRGLLRTALQKLEEDPPKESKADKIQKAVLCVSSTIGPERHCSTLCVSGASLRPAGSVPTSDQIASARAMHAAMHASAKDLGQRKIFFPERTKGCLEMSSSILES